VHGVSGFADVDLSDLYGNQIHGVWWIATGTGRALSLHGSADKQYNECQ
jgi:hypothetical protein